MSITFTSQRFDLARLVRAIEDRDAGAQAAFYASDAQLEIADRDRPPSLPLVLNGSKAITQHLHELAARDMTHEVRHLVRGGDRAALTVACRYPDGSRVLCMTALDLRDGLIARQTTVQAWDS